MTRSMIGLAGLAGLLAACSAETEMPDTSAAAGTEMPVESPASTSADTAETAMADTTQEAAETSGNAVTTVDIREWPVPWEGRPRDPYTLDGQTVWFVGQVNSYIARLDVGTGEMERIDLREGAGPHNLIVDETGDVWYAGNRDAHIGRYDVESGTFEIIDTPRDTAADPHTQIFDGNGDIWFTSQRANSIGKLTLADRSLQIIPVETERSRPYGIRIAPDGRIWSVLFGTNRLAMVDPETMALTEIELPRETTRPRRMDITSDGRIWYGDYADGYLGVYDPTDGSITEWPMPSGENSRPYALIADGQDRIWFVETGVDPNYFVGFDPSTESFFSVTAVPSGGGVIRHMQYLAATGEIWFGSDMGTVGRAQVEER